MLKFTTKANTLKALEAKIKNAKILPQVSFSIEQWVSNKKALLSAIKKRGWIKKPLIIRSSSQIEDTFNNSMAGHFTSILDVKGEKNIAKAIDKVMSSYEKQNLKDQILIQPFLQKVLLSGVAFSKDPDMARPYIIINYDDKSGKTDSVTGGYTNKLKTFYYFKYSDVEPPHQLKKIITLINELEDLFKIDNLDIEFAITQNDIYLLQARPLIIKKNPSTSCNHSSILKNVYNKINNFSKPHPYLYGEKTIFGVMPDWNPAEIIGIRPRPLALSLYKEVITDNIWAYQRDNYGYRNLRSFPLLISFHGLPYIDVRVSFNSFIPADLDDKIAQKLVNYYLKQLEDNPHLHDKIEFEIIYSCYTLDLKTRLQVLQNNGFSKKECEIIADNLRLLTNKIINNKNGFCFLDLKKINHLKEKHSSTINSSLDSISKMYWLLEDCKRYGTLPFAGLARAGFIAIQLLKSLVAEKIINTDEYNIFLNSLNTISSSMFNDFITFSKKKFLKKYGHLRPGTYDILSYRYDEKPDLYFDWSKKNIRKAKMVSFNLSLTQMKKIQTLLNAHNLNHDIISFFDFIKNAIIGREYAKFVFTNSLSEILKLFYHFAKKYGFTKEDCSFVDINCIKTLYMSSADPHKVIEQSVKKGKMEYELSKHLILPPIITKPEEVYSFHLPSVQPNFITLKKTIGCVRLIHEDKQFFDNAILFIPSADPGFDWIFSHNIKAFITMYGGINSHMAIRAGELNLPAVIGAGETLFKKWSTSKVIELDCCNKQVKILQK